MVFSARGGAYLDRGAETRRIDRGRGRVRVRRTFAWRPVGRAENDTSSIADAPRRRRGGAAAAPHDYLKERSKICGSFSLAVLDAPTAAPRGVSLYRVGAAMRAPDVTRFV